MSSRWVNWLLRAGALVVPRWRRDEWLREWRAELASARPDIRLALGTIPDALVVRGHALQLELWWSDVTLAVRTLARRPGFACLVVLTLALGLGADAGVFALVDRVLLRPLPYQGAERLVIVWSTLQTTDRRDVEPTPFDYQAWQAASSFESLAMLRSDAVAIAGDREPERVRAARITASTFRVLALSPILGRAFVNAEDDEAAPPTVILSDRLWRRRWGGDPTILGRTLRLDGVPHTVVGIMPARATLPSPLAQDDELWLPAHLSAADRLNQISHNYTVIGRLASGVTVAQASAEVATLAKRIASEHPSTHGLLGAHVVPAQDEAVRQVRPALAGMFAAVTLLLAIAIANVGTLTVARAEGRRGEMAIREALGATATRLASLGAAETLVLSGVGGIAAVGVAGVLLRWLAPAFAGSSPRAADVQIDGRSTAWTLLLTALIGAVLAIVGLVHRRARGATRLGQDGRSPSQAGHGRGRYVLVVLQVACCVVLLLSATLMLRSYRRLTAVSPGFAADGVLTAHLALSDLGYGHPAARVGFVSALTDRLTASGAVVTASVNSRLPFTGNRGANEVAIEGRVFAADSLPIVDQREIGPDYFRVLQIPLRRGRPFTGDDDQRGTPVAIVNETMARRFWPDEDPIGHRVRVTSGPEASTWLAVVGIVGDVRHSGLARPAPAELYRPYAQMPLPDFFVVLKARSDASGAVTDLRSAVHALDPDLPVYDVRLMTERLDASVAATRATALLFLVAAGFACALAAVGLYGSIWYAVLQRQAEIAIRLALGASNRSVVGNVLKRALIQTGAGAAVGLAIVAAAAPWLRLLLFETPTDDPAAYGAVAALLVGVTLAASVAPVVRALRVDPLQALRAC